MAEKWKQWEGQVVNEEFPLRRYLGGSDHGAVFLTERGEPGAQKAAIKLIAVNAEDPEIQLSWWELAAKLSHPHLLRLAQRGRCQLDEREMLYAVSEYAEENLAQILPHRPLTSAESLDMLLAVVDVLAYIHSKGFVHGHIKPSNVMAVGDDVKISSDGLCGAGESSTVLGHASVYSAPEIADGGGMSPASDVWSLGMTLVEAMTQHPPVWEGTEQNEPVVPSKLPEPFLEIARHCLRRNPRERWTIAEISARLRASSSVPSIEPAPLEAKKSRYFIAVAAGLLLLAIVAVPRALKRRPDAEPVTTTAVGSSETLPEPKPAGQPAPETMINQNKQQNSTVPAAVRRANKAAGTTSASTGAHGSVLDQVVPEVPRSARNTLHGKLKVGVKLTVDQSGNVAAAKFESHGPSKYFAKLAFQAAQRWTFKPPQIEGQGVASEWVVKFEFSRAATNVHAAQTLP